MLDQLALLVDKSLSGGRRARAARYRLLRQCVGTRWKSWAPARPILHAVTGYYTALASSAPADNDHQRLVAQAEDRIDNLRAAFAWAGKMAISPKRYAARIFAAANLVRAGAPARLLVQLDPGRPVPPARCVNSSTGELADKAMLGTWLYQSGRRHRRIAPLSAGDGT